MLPLCAAPLASENPCDLSAKVFRDPHINFAYGGSADLRGRHNALYNFLSAPGLSVNVKTEEAMFKIHDGALTVNGSFLTEAHVVARVYSRYTAEASFFAALRPGASSTARVPGGPSGSASTEGRSASR